MSLASFTNAKAFESESRWFSKHKKTGKRHSDIPETQQRKDCSEGTTLIAHPNNDLKLKKKDCC
jgi:hypothetical protein